MRLFASILCSLFLISCSSVPNSPTATPESSYSLDWKIGENEVVAYRTAMNPVDSTNTTIAFNFDQLFAGDPLADQISQQLSGLQLPQVATLISILQPNSRGNISVRMIVDEIEPVQSQSADALSDAFSQMAAQMEGTVQLRGEITPDGEIASFYFEERQRNLLAIFFELPTEPVHVGDRWRIDFNCISMGAGFIADQAAKINQVQLTGTTQTSDGKPVAIMDYVLAETVDGNFRSLISGEVSPTSMSCGFIGRGEFLIDEGRWQQFTGEFKLVSTGLMTANNVQQFGLSPLDIVPEAYLSLE